MIKGEHILYVKLEQPSLNRWGGLIRYLSPPTLTSLHQWFHTNSHPQTLVPWFSHKFIRCESHPLLKFPPFSKTLRWVVNIFMSRLKVLLLKTIMRQFTKNRSGQYSGDNSGNSELCEKNNRGNRIWVWVYWDRTS